MSFKPIASYGFIGNLGSCALVGLDGSIDWCCLPCLDSPSVFGAILDPDKGGAFSIAPADGGATIAQEYLPRTNILRTTFTLPEGVLEVTDWMHMSDFHFQQQEEHILPAIYRMARCVSGSVACRACFHPRLDYARCETKLSLVDGGLKAEGTDDVLHLYGALQFSVSGRGAEALVTLREGDEFTLICSYGNAERDNLPQPHRSLERTAAFWKRWSEECETGNCLAPGPWKEEILRSALVLKVLAGGKGIAAAATSSLPEIPGGKENWDYRFTWIRDASFTIQALASIGHLNDAREFLDWIAETLLTSGRRPADLRVLYPLYGTTLRAEEELPHLRGYLDSRPVRIGNAAADQRQHDIYGELLEAVFRSEHLHPGMDHALSGVLRDVVDYVCEIWREPDHGIWELRREPQHHVHSKVMCWVALDRGIRLAEEHGWNVDVARWRRERDAAKAEILERGYDEKRGAFMQAYGSDVLDATALLLPVLEFIPPDHPFALHTLDAIERELSDGPLVYRTSAHHRKEGAFGLCSFWMVDALAFAGKMDSARERFDGLLRMGNHLGLYAEEIDPRSGAFLGNFPQAFTHVGLINSAIYLRRFLGAPPQKQPLIGEKHLPDGVS